MKPALPSLPVRPPWLVRSALVVLLVVGLAGQLAAAPPNGRALTSSPQRVVVASDEEAGLELITAAFNVLQSRFFRPLDSRALLSAAWRGTQKVLNEQRRSTGRVSAPQLVGDRDADLAAFSTQYRAILVAAGPDVQGARVAMAATAAMADSVGEQHTFFMTPEQFVQYKASLTSDQGMVGLGIGLSGQTGPFTITSVVPASPAEQAGVQEGDQVERVEGHEARRMEPRELLDLLRGEAGQPVTLTLRRGDVSLEITVVRGRFVIPPLATRVLPEGVCLLRLSSFPFAFVVGPSGRTIGKDLDAALEQCEVAGARGWIVDLRGNGGGSSMAQVLGRFMDSGPVLVERDRIGGRYEQATDGHLFRVQRPLVVLIDGGSASASEGFASAIQESGRGLVVGQRSAAALATATIVALPLDSGMEVAIREVYTGRREVVVDEVGVSPDVEVTFDRDPSVIPRRAIELALNPPPGIGPLPPPPPDPPGAVLSEPELRRLIEPVQLRPEDAERPEDAITPGDLPVDTLDYYASDWPSLDTGRARALRLGWRGGLVRYLGKGFPPPYSLDVEIYRDADGAHRDLRDIYEPDEPHNPPQYRDVDPPIALGDDTRALVGTGQNEDRIWIAWRRGGVLYVVARNLVPGQPAAFEPLVRLAQIVDARAAASGP